MKHQDTPFQTGWWSVDLGKYRPCNGTYCYYDYASIPPLLTAQLQGKFDWLQVTADAKDVAPAQPTHANHMAALQKSAKGKNLTLPAPFVTFMQNIEWQERIPSCTACEFTLSREVIPDPLKENFYFVPFLIDQQSVLIWYLYMNAASDYCVVTTPWLWDDDLDNPQLPTSEIHNETFYCAETFEAFMYRFWIENAIWFALNSANELTPSQKTYLAHYQKP